MIFGEPFGDFPDHRPPTTSQLLILGWRARLAVQFKRELSLSLPTPATHAVHHERN